MTRNLSTYFIDDKYYSLRIIGILSSGFSDLSRETKEKSKYFYRLMSRSLSRMSPACRAFNKWKLVTQVSLYYCGIYNCSLHEEDSRIIDALQKKKI